MLTQLTQTFSACSNVSIHNGCLNKLFLLTWDWLGYYWMNHSSPHLGFVDRWVEIKCKFRRKRKYEKKAPTVLACKMNLFF